MTGIPLPPACPEVSCRKAPASPSVPPVHQQQISRNAQSLGCRRGSLSRRQTWRMSLVTGASRSPAWDRGKNSAYSVNSIFRPHSRRSGSGMYFESLLRIAHSRRRVEWMYSSGCRLNSPATRSNSLLVAGSIGPDLPQFGLLHLCAMRLLPTPALLSGKIAVPGINPSLWKLFFVPFSCRIGTSRFSHSGRRPAPGSAGLLSRARRYHRAGAPVQDRRLA